MKRLSNGVQLDKKMVSTRTDYSMSKGQARRAFLGTAEKVYIRCVKKNCGCGVGVVAVGRTEKSISIGCVRFSPAAVQLVKEWLKAASRK